MRQMGGSKLHVVSTCIVQQQAQNPYIHLRFQLNMSIIIHVHYITISARLRFSQCARHELDSFERHFDRLNDTVAKVNFAWRNRTFSTYRTIGTSPLLHNGIFFGNRCNIYHCQATANKRQFLSFLVERMKTEQLNMNLSGITLLYCLLFLGSLHFMFISKEIDDFQFRYVQGRKNFILVFYRSNLILSHEWDGLGMWRAWVRRGGV